MTISPPQPSQPNKPDPLRRLGFVLIAVGAAIFLFDLFLNLEHLQPISPPIVAFVIALIGVMSVVVSYVKGPKMHR